MRVSSNFVYIVIIFIVIAALSFSNDMTIKDIPDDLFISMDSEEVKVLTKLYFVDRDVLKYENRYINFNDSNFLNNIGDELEKGPKTKIYDSMFSGDVRIISIDKIDEVCYLNLSEDVFNTSYWDIDKKELYIWSLVNTFTDVEGVTSVQILIGGKKINDYAGEYNLIKPLKRREEFIYIKKVYPSDIVIKFVDNISNNRLDIAYDFLDKESRNRVDFEKFQEKMEEYQGNISGYKRQIYFTQEFTEDRIVYVRYEYKGNSDLDNMPATKYEHWRVIKEGEEWKVSLF